MKPLAVALAITLAASVPAPSQSPAGAPAIREEKASGVEVRFAGFPWRPDIFQALEDGATPAPRPWAFARLLTHAFFAIDEKVIPPGHYVLVLNPRTGGLAMTLEVRRAEMRETGEDMNALPPPPPGETVYKAPASFTTEPQLAPTLDITLAGWNDGASMTIRYGNRKLTKDLVRAMP